jgi:hypothetical protein
LQGIASASSTKLDARYLGKGENAYFAIKDMYSCMEIAYLWTLLALPLMKLQGIASLAIKVPNYITILASPQREIRQI